MEDDERSDKTGFVASKDPLAKPAAQRVTNGGPYVGLPTGSLDLGWIDDTMATTIESTPGPIRLTERDERHIAMRHPKLLTHGFSGVAEFVRGVAADFHEIWPAGGKSRMLVRRVWSGERSQYAHSLFVVLRPVTDATAYEVQSGGVFSAGYLRGGGRKLLWRGERANIVSTGTDSRMPIANASEHKAGTRDASARDQSRSYVIAPATICNN